MQTTLQHFSQYSTDSTMEWPGLTSSRFPKMRLMHPRRDIIHSGISVYIQVLTCLMTLLSLVGGTIKPVTPHNTNSNLD